MAFMISARFRLGFYQGHWDEYSNPDRYPSVCRLQSALIAAAGSIAAEGGVWDLSAESNKGLKDALEWLEENPPDAILIPSYKVNRVNSINYRNRSNERKYEKKYEKNPKKYWEGKGSKAVSHVAYSSDFAWIWEKYPEKGIRETLEMIAPEVPYLGEAESPVRLFVGEARDVENAKKLNDSDLDSDSGFDPSSGILIECPKPGRFGKLVDIYSLFNERSKSDKKPKTFDERLKSAKELELGLREIRQYGAFEQRPVGPWQYGYLFSVRNVEGERRQWCPLQSERLAWAEAVHKTIVKRLASKDVPSFLLPPGRVGSFKGANRLAVHVLEHEMPLAVEMPNDSYAILLMFPAGVGKEEAVRVVSALKNAKVNLGSSGAIRLENPEEIDLSNLWKKPETGFRRYWRPSPFFVSDVRPPKNKAKRNKEIGNLMSLSLGYVFRDLLPVTQSENKGLRLHLKNQIDAKGVHVCNEEEVYPGKLANYTHHCNQNASFLAATGLIDLGDLMGGCETAALAIGQSRHFGVGLLVPYDEKVSDENKGA